jgi:hypothetical protein
MELLLHLAAGGTFDGLPVDFVSLPRMGDISLLDVPEIPDVVARDCPDGIEGSKLLVTILAVYRVPEKRKSGREMSNSEVGKLQESRRNQDGG